MLSGTRDTKDVENGPSLGKSLRQSWTSLRRLLPVRAERAVILGLSLVLLTTPPVRVTRLEPRGGARAAYIRRKPRVHPPDSSEISLTTQWHLHFLPLRSRHPAYKHSCRLRGREPHTSPPRSLSPKIGASCLEGSTLVSRQCIPFSCLSVVMFSCSIVPVVAVVTPVFWRRSPD